MRINKRHVASLLDKVVLPFEKFVLEDSRLSHFIETQEAEKIHNMAVAKLSVYIYSDINRAYEYIQMGAKIHKEKGIEVSYLREYYSLYFRLCKEWNETSLKSDKIFLENLATIEEFVYNSFAKEDQSKDEFFIYDSETINEDIKKMHYKEETKISARDFLAEESIDELDIQDMIESSKELASLTKDGVQNSDDNFGTLLKELSTYATILERSLEFRDLGFSLYTLAQFIERNAPMIKNHKNANIFYTIIDTIAEDMIAWTDALFIDKTAIDIHYLDASLLSSILQAQMLFKEEEPASEEGDDDLEFF